MSVTATEEYNPILLTVTGSIVTWWGRIESALFHDLLTLQHDEAVKADGLCERLPTATGDLIKTWLKATRLVETDEKWLSELELIADELLECSQDRHVLVHGFWDYPDPAKTDHTKITVMKPRKQGKLQFAQYDVDINNLLDMDRRFRSLYHRILPFSLNHGFRLGPKIFAKSGASDGAEP